MMRPIRRNRLITVAFLFAGATLTVALVLLAVDENLNLFYPPELVVSGEAPTGTAIRAGGMVLDGSVQRIGQDLDVEFVLTDYQYPDHQVLRRVVDHLASRRDLQVDRSTGDACRDVGAVIGQCDWHLLSICR